MNVRSVVGSFKAFCALLSDGQVVAWGDAKSGGVVPPSVEGRTVLPWSILNGISLELLGTIGISMDFIGNEWKFKHRKFKFMEIGNEGDYGRWRIKQYCPEIHQWGMFRRGFNFKIQGTFCALCNYIILYLTYIHIMEVSWNRSTPSHHPFFLGIFHVSLTIHKPSSYLNSPIYEQTTICILCIWLVVSNIFYCSISYMGCHAKPIDELHHFSRLFFNHQPGILFT